MGKRSKERVSLAAQLVIGEDDDLIRWYRNLPDGTGASEIKRLLRSALGLPENSKPKVPLYGAVTEADLNRELDKLAGDFREYVKAEIQKALNSLDYTPVSQYAPADTAKVNPETLAERKKNILEDSW